MREDAFVDSSTRHVLGVEAYLDWLRPDSPAGQRRGQALDAYGVNERDGWEREVERSRQAESWADTHHEALEAVRDALSNLPDTRRALRRLHLEETLDESDLFAVKRFLFYAHTCITEAGELLERDPHTSDWSARAEALMDRIHPEKRRTSRFHLASALDERLAARRKDLRACKRRERELRDAFEEEILDDVQGRFDIRGHFRPAKSCDEGDLREDARLVYAAGAWQPSDPALDRAKDEREEAQEAVEAREYHLRETLSAALAAQRPWLETVERTLAELDLQLAKGRLRDRMDGTWPGWSDESGTHIVGGTEFRVLRMLEDTVESVQPVDVELGEEPSVVSGPNMGGKSSLLRLVGLAQWAAQHALPVPAESYSFAPVEAIVYVGSEEPIAEHMTEGLSSFGREVRRLVEWWERGASPRLWLLDEVGRGTHPDEGARIAGEIITRLHQRGDRCIAATHFPAVAGMDGARKLRIAGLTDPTVLDELLKSAERDSPDDAPADLQRALRAAMDYRPLPVRGHDVPRDARVVARALGLPLEEDE